MKKNKIYVGGGFTEDQLLWIFPIISNYFKDTSTKTIFLENKLSSDFKKNNYIKRYLDNFKFLNQKNLFLLKSKI